MYPKIPTLAWQGYLSRLKLMAAQAELWEPSKLTVISS